VKIYAVGLSQNDLFRPFDSGEFFHDRMPALSQPPKSAIQDHHIHDRISFLSAKIHPLS
jgi:hypothetical protein